MYVCMYTSEFNWIPYHYTTKSAARSAALVHLPTLHPLTYWELTTWAALAWRVWVCAGAEQCGGSSGPAVFSSTPYRSMAVVVGPMDV
eukprot:COSAG01_NODE_49744_length_369_cov_1.096296_1_plen_87_part_01